MKRLSILALPLMIAASLTACKRHQNDAQDAANQAPAATTQAAETPGAAPAPAEAAPATAAAKPFDLQSVPMTTKEDRKSVV